MSRDRRHPHRLIVEGSDDLFTIVNLSARHGLDWNDGAVPALPYVHDARSVEQALRELGVSLKTQTRVGIVVDADADPAGRWRELVAATHGLVPGLPENAPAEGFVGAATNGCRFGAWLMPDNARPGALEDLLVGLVPRADPVWGLALESSTEALARGARFPAKHQTKATVRAWLAWRREPGLPPGSALERGYLDASGSLAESLTRWIRAVFLES